jgi:LuxR family maltose regulon positive regulatory protein
MLIPLQNGCLKGCRMDIEEPGDNPLASGWQALASGAWEDAHAVFTEAVGQEESPEALEGLAMAAWWLDHVAETFHARETAYRLYNEQGDRRGAARVALWLSLDHTTRHGEHAIANGWMRRAYRLLDGLEPGPELAMAKAIESHIAIMVEHNTAKARQLSGQAAELSRALGVIDLEMYAQSILGFALVCEGNVAEGMHLLDETTAAAVSGEMSDIDTICTTCCLLIYACERVRDLDRAAQWCEKAQKLAERWSSRFYFSFCLTHYAGILIARGEWSRAEQILVASNEEVADSHPAMAYEGVVRLADLRRRQGRFDEAEALLDSTNGKPLHLLGKMPALLGRALLAEDRGDPASAVDLAERYLRSFHIDNQMERVEAYEVLVRAHLALGAREEALRALETLISITNSVPTPSLRGCASISQGFVAIAGTDYGQARRCFEDAVDLFEQSGALYDAAQARTELATVLMALGRADAAYQEADAAEQAFARFGASRDRERAAALMRSIKASRGDGNGKSPSAHGLTKREVEVLRLVAQGQSDKEIANSLGLSDHTVHRHMSNVLTKTGLPSRSAAVAHAAHLGLL